MASTLSPKESSHYLQAHGADLVKKISHQTMQSSCRILEMCITSEQIGTNTATKLQTNQEKLQRIQVKVREANEHMKEIDRNLDEIERPCCFAFLYNLNKSVKLKCCSSNVSDSQNGSENYGNTESNKM